MPPYDARSDAEPARWATLTVATCNLLNLAQPGRTFYAGQDPYTEAEHGRKLDWLGNRFKALNADVLAVQEVWDEVALRGAIARSGLRYTHVSVPGAENGPGQHGAQGTPRVGLATRLQVEAVESLTPFPAEAALEVLGLGRHDRFERPPLLATLRMKHGQRVHVGAAGAASRRYWRRRRRPAAVAKPCAAARAGAGRHGFPKSGASAWPDR